MTCKLKERRWGIRTGFSRPPRGGRGLKRIYALDVKEMLMVYVKFSARVDNITYK